MEVASENMAKFTDDPPIIVDRSEAKAMSCLNRLTHWVPSRDSIQFAITQLEHYHSPWMLKQRSPDGFVAVYVPGPRTDEFEAASDV